MPKLKQTPARRSQLLFLGNLDKRIRVEDMTYGQLAKVIGMPLSTLNSRKANPEDFKLSEMKIIFKALHFTDAEILESVKGV